MRRHILCGALILAAVSAAAGARADILLVTPLVTDPNARDHPEPGRAARIARDRAVEMRIDGKLRHRHARLGCVGSDGTAIVLRRDGRILRDAFRGDPVILMLPGLCR